MAEREPNQSLLRAAARLARDRATPFYLFDPVQARDRAQEWARHRDESGRPEVFYPWKCNRHSALLEILVREGLGAEVTSSGDLAGALAAGLPGDRIVFQGPAKDAASLDRALAAGVRLVADSPEDAGAILSRGRALGIVPRYLLRLRAGGCQTEQREFGMPARALVATARSGAKERRPAPEGLAFHLGTGLTSPAPYRRAIREAAGIARHLAALGMKVSTLDVGGGFPAHREARRDVRGRVQKAPSLSSFLRALVAEAADRFPGVRLLAEPGRALASDAFHLVTRVVRVRGRRVYVDGSRMSHALFVPRGKHLFRPLPFRGSRARRSEIAGPLPVGLDVLAKSEAVGQPREGDLLLIESVGAYNLIASNAWAGEAEVVEMSTPST